MTAQKIKRGRRPSPEAQRRSKFTTKLDRGLIKKLKRLAIQREVPINALIEQAVRRHWGIK